MYVPTFILWIAILSSLILIIGLVLVLRHLIKQRDEFEDKCNELMKVQLDFLTVIWNAQCTQPMTSWVPLERMLEHNLFKVMKHNNHFEARQAAELAMAIVLCGADVTTVRLLRDIGQESSHIVPLMKASADRIKTYHRDYRNTLCESPWSGDAIYGLVLFLRGQRLLSAIADPCSGQEVIDGNRWLNGEQ